MGAKIKEAEFERIGFAQAVKIKDVLIQDEKIYAHTPKKTREQPEAVLEAERLSEHIERSFYYFKQLCQNRHLTDCFDRMREELLPEVSEGAVALFNELLVNVVIFHDMGKINPAFQRVKMKNNQNEDLKQNCLDGTKHAMLSAAIYADYFLARIAQCTLPKNEMEMLHVILLANAYVISKHHVSLSPFALFLNEFEQGQKLNAIFTALNAGVFRDLYRGPFYRGKPALEQMSVKNRKCMAHFYANRTAGMALYTYTRFLYSILISCDYYATSTYESGIKMADFGCVSDICGIRALYEGSPLLKTMRQFHPESFVDDGKDINVLRNQMFYEAERNLQANRDKNIYFLEAPTGWCWLVV